MFIEYNSTDLCTHAKDEKNGRYIKEMMGNTLSSGVHGRSGSITSSLLFIERNFWPSIIFDDI